MTALHRDYSESLPGSNDPFQCLEGLISATVACFDAGLPLRGAKTIRHHHPDRLEQTHHEH
jgi:hypothetical protein